MKPSKFNLIFPVSHGEDFIIYNTLSGSAAVMDLETKNFVTNLKPGTDYDEHSRILKGLFDEGFVTDDVTDENRIFEVMFNTRKYNAREIWFTVMTTYSCNLACPYCYQGGGVSTPRKMDPGTALSVADFIKNYTANARCRDLTVLLYGGEPLLNFEVGMKVIEAIEPWAAEAGINFGTGLITNGTLFNEEIGKRILKYENSLHQITLDGPKRIHDKRRIYKNGQGTYDDVIRALRIFTDLGIRNLLLRIDIDRENVRYIGELLNDLKDKGLQHIPLGFGLIEPKTEACTNYSSSCIAGSELSKFIPQLWEAALEEGFDVKLRPHIPFVYCGAQTNFSFIVDPGGDVYKCSNFVGQKKHCIGSIKEHGELTRLSFEYFNWMSRNPLSIENCRKCRVLPLCGGGCAGLAYTEHGTYHREKCGGVKYLIRSQLNLYLREKFPNIFAEETTLRNNTPQASGPVV